MASPEVCILKTDGINCDEEMSNAFQVAGAHPELVHVNQLRSGDKKLGRYRILAIPGGFSYGDDIASGKVLATELTSYLSDQLQDFVDKKKPIIGVCNGFQVLARTGLLPYRAIGEQHVTLAENEVGRFECRWIDLAVGQSACRFVRPEDFDESTLPMQTAHGEGRFFGSDEQIRRLAANGQVVFRYARPDLSEPVAYPDNPNGAIDNIAGICDESGLILGMMPHPERSIAAFHPYRVRTEAARRAASTIFSNIVHYARKA
jgi:phosphoribosylformylglycinamidine synthase I